MRIHRNDGAAEPSQTGEDAITARASRHASVLAHGFDGASTNRWSEAGPRRQQVHIIAHSMGGLQVMGELAVPESRY